MTAREMLRSAVAVLVGPFVSPPSEAVPLVLAGALVHDRAGRLLLIHRATAEAEWWEVPGGKVEDGEERWQAAARELAEELGTKIETVAEIGTDDFEHNGRWLRYTWYLAHLLGGEPRVVEEDRFDRIGYFSVAEVEGLDDLSPSLRQLLTSHRGPLDRALSSCRGCGLQPGVDPAAVGDGRRGSQGAHGATEIRVTP